MNGNKFINSIILSSYFKFPLKLVLIKLHCDKLNQQNSIDKLAFIPSIEKFFNILIKLFF